MFTKVRSFFGGDSAAKDSEKKNLTNGKSCPDTFPPLKIEGIKDAPLTAEPDERELAAQALLEVLVQEKRGRHRSNAHKPHQPQENQKNSAYYHRLAERVKQAHYTSRLRLMRFLAFCEEQLMQKDLPWYGAGSVALLETELYKRIDVVEREGGELKTRWKHCLADVTVRMMSAPAPPESKEDSLREETR